MTLLIILAILLLSFVLIRSADAVVTAVRRLTIESNVGKYAVSALILALGTSFPELFVGITSALENTSHLVLGVVLGSNIANICLVSGFTGVFTGHVKISRSRFKHKVSVAFVAGLLPVILVLDGSLNRVDGLILLSIYGAYTTSFFKKTFVEIGTEQSHESFLFRFLTQKRKISREKTREYGRLFVGIALLLFASDLIVKMSQYLAELSGISVFVIGLIILAAGTSLPEFVFSLRSVDSGETEMFLGNILGSIIVNSTLIVGLSAVISPIHVQEGSGYLLASATFVIVFLLFWRFIRSKFTLTRWESIALVTIYLVFLLLELR